MTGLAVLRRKCHTKVAPLHPGKVVVKVEVHTCFDEGTLEQRFRPREGRPESLDFWGS